jgi:hypothetical protein
MKKTSDAKKAAFLPIRTSTRERQARSKAASLKAAAGLPQSKAFGQIHPLPFSLRTQLLCVSFDIKTMRERSVAYSKPWNHRFH